ncbi:MULTISPECIES: TIGR01906 family membrane protein [Erysipelothrix]|uniref:TIGR01906 family membrane protein n=1 Tax=Erysipelothrix TaxID=1647 RepID=UPI001378A0DE|nr:MULTISPECIES: TIGR01906 family membrane protein [unclassified Erysipelothrix]MBK2401812.1 TIGR01906 family membrane protein [Erysipelothrix sp. strain 2 (EsS2-6-Brazil)]MBK2404048.1 TIGR01906 family membrane protein [Erysipelothrix sp. strain 2 (EsS2-7-Brazil)]NBA00900.1 TIGR01906 family membrane protein [Erysipelothrix rhusiopathiae]
MKRKCYGFAVMIFVICMMITAIDLLSFNRRMYETFYKRDQTAQKIGITETELEDVTVQLLNYLKDREPSLSQTVVINGETVPMFNEREQEHMKDVKVLYQKAMLFRNLGMIFVAMMIVVSLGSGDYLDLVLNRDVLGSSLMILLMILGTIGMIAILDFDTFWLTFHNIVFSNDLWLLNPRVDRLILLVPEPFFMGLVYQILAATAALFALMGGAYFGLDWKVKYDSRRALRTGDSSEHR